MNSSDECVVQMSVTRRGDGSNEKYLSAACQPVSHQSALVCQPHQRCLYSVCFVSVVVISVAFV